MWKCEHVSIVDTVFCPTSIHMSKQRLEKKSLKQYKTMNFKPKKGKINTTCLNGESKIHNIWKNPFYRKSGQNPNLVWSKFWLFDLTIGSCWILDLLVGNIFPLEMIVYELKSELKWMRYHKNTKTLIKSSLYFSGKLTVLPQLCAINCINWAITGINGLDLLEEQDLS